MTIEWVVAFLVGTLAVARLNRLVIDDSFPPVVAGLRLWDRLTNRSHWNTLFHCYWCLGVWLSFGSFAWAWISDLNWTWWLWNAPLAASMIAGMVNVRDLPEDQRG